MLDSSITPVLFKILATSSVNVRIILPVFKSRVKFITSGRIKSALCSSTCLITADIGFPAISRTPLTEISKCVVFWYLPKSLFIALKLAKVEADMLIVISGEFCVDTVPSNGKVLVWLSVREN